MSTLTNHKTTILIATGTALFVSLASVGLYVAFEKYIHEPLHNEMRTPHITPLAPPAQAEEVPSFVWPDTDEATNKDLNTRYAALETLKLDVAVAEQAKRLQDLRTEVEELSSKRDALLEEAHVEPKVQQQKTVVTPEPKAHVEPKAAEPAKEATGPQGPKLMGVYGLDGTLRASFSTPEGKRTVQQGQSLFGSRVTAITLESVSFANGTTFYVGQ